MATVRGPPDIVRSMDDLLWLDATAQAQLVRNGDVAAVELVDSAIARIERFDPRLNAVILRRFERVREEARAGLPDGPFRGVPFLLKDVLCQVEGEPFHAGMRVLKAAGYRSDHDSYLGARYKCAGFAILGKSNLSEMALSPITDSVAYGATLNPWDLQRTAGGSSGGAAAAVAAGFVPVAHGSDSGGSIRIPASCCGVVGLKPSRGRITLGPDFGEHFGEKTCEHVLTRSVRDSAAVLDACAGPAPGDPCTAPPPLRPWRDEAGADPGRLRIGFRTLRADERGWDPACAAAVESTVRLLADLGHEVEDDSPACLDTLVDRPLIEQMHLIKYAHVASALQRVGALLGRKLGAADVEPNTWERCGCGAWGERRATDAGDGRTAPLCAPAGTVVGGRLARSWSRRHWRRCRSASRRARLKPGACARWTCPGRTGSGRNRWDWPPLPGSTTCRVSPPSPCRCTGARRGCRSEYSSSPTTAARTCCSGSPRSSRRPAPGPTAGRPSNDSTGQDFPALPSVHLVVQLSLCWGRIPACEPYHPPMPGMARSHLLDGVTGDADVAIITRRDAEDAVVMSLDYYNSLVEMVHLLTSPANAAHLSESIEQLRAGKVVARNIVAEQP